MTADDKHARDAAVDTFEEYAQSVTELICSNVEHVPIIKAIDALARTALSVRDHILERKILACLRALKEVPTDHLRDMVARLESDPSYGRKVGQHVVEVLDRVDSHRKPAMIGAVFAGYARGAIELRMLYRLNDSIERLSTIDIDSVRRFKEWHDTRQQRPLQTGSVGFSISELHHAGFTHMQSTYGGLGYIPNDICAAYVSLNLDKVR